MNDQSKTQIPAISNHGRLLGRREAMKALGVLAAGAGIPAWLATSANSQTTRTGAIRTESSFYRNTIGPSDDGSSPQINLPFPLNFLGVTFNHLWVNNNGNMTFDSPFLTWTPFDLTSANKQIVAPLFCDTDTRQGPPSLPVTYGFGTVNCYRAFAANWVSVGYYPYHSNKLNSFQGIFVDRSDTGSGNFDIEFNIGQVKWEASDIVGGTNGLGGPGIPTARVGFSNGTGRPGTSYEYPGSGIYGSFLDNGTRPLIRQQLNSTVPGRLRFFARNGHLVTFEDVSDQVLAMRPIRYVYNPSTRLYSGTISIVNIGPRNTGCSEGDAPGTLGPHITMCLPRLPQGVVHMNRTGTTRSGASFMSLPSASIPLRGAVHFPVVFSNPNNVPLGSAFLNYPVHVYTGNFVATMV